MKFLNRFLLLCFVGHVSVFAQNLATTINASSCEKPEYPSASKRLEEEGTVQLKFLVGADGKVIESAVEKSSGFRRLDEAARQSLAKCTFKPGTKDGVAVESWASMKYTWALSNPKCVGTDISKWTSCLGTLSTPLGGLSVVEYVAGKKRGLGIEYDATGNVIRAGVFDGENLVLERNLNTKLYPFNAKLSANSANQSVNNAAVPANISTSNLPACQGSNIAVWSNCVGSATFNDGNRYVGEFKDGKLNGQGTYISTSGVKLVGEFKDSQLNGQGTVTHPNGEKTVGEFKDGKRNGQGTNTFASGNKYVGQFKDDAYNGQGTFTFASGDKYVGEWKDNRHNGQGTLYGSNGLVINQGIWTDGKLVDSVPVQQLTTSNSEIEKLRAEADEAKLKQVEVQLKLAQQSVQPNKPTVSSVNERRVALVIGNATYKVNPLKNPVNDSTDMARSLRSVGFDVIEANNATLAQMREATRRFADKLGNSDVGLVYYSGHGVEVKGKNYLIPVNADIKREYEVVDQAFDASQFLEMMDNIRGPNNKRVNILIVDACRNNELQKSWRSTNNGLARMDAPGGTFISFATAPGRVAADGTGRNSPYTKHLLQALKQPNVPIEQVFKVVRRNVMEETKGEQIPWENSSLVGDFYFTVQR
jgi:TonB family protein